MLLRGMVLQSPNGDAPDVSQVWENTPGCGDAPFLDTIWTAIDEAVTLQDCEVYSYKSDGEADPFGMRRSFWC